jgi:hypothetical protein
MEPKETPRVLRLIDEAEMLISRMEDKLAHVLLPSYPTPTESKSIGMDEPQSGLTINVRRLVRRLGELNDRIES